MKHVHKCIGCGDLINCEKTDDLWSDHDVMHFNCEMVALNAYETSYQGSFSRLYVEPVHLFLRKRWKEMGLKTRV